MPEHPYKSGPSYTYWRKAVGSRDMKDVDPVAKFDLKINRNTRVATAGSCFAQHIARHLRMNGFNYYITESGHSVLPEAVRKENNYGLYSARYGNIYTSRQLLQLMERAYHLFQPVEDCWQDGPDVFIDPFRPSAQPGGFISELEMRLDREQHLRCVREMFETLDVFVFTLGLTECWVSRADGAVFPICPGVEGGEFDETRHLFCNETVDDVVSEMSAFLMHLARVNPRAQVILTVSPVPIAATARKDQHVLAASTYSKSVLRVAADMIASRYPHVHYFPSYEIVTGSFSRGSYYAPDLRSVLEEGVAHVMELFIKHVTVDGDADPVPTTVEKTPMAAPSKVRANVPDTTALASKLVEVECDEAALDPE